MSALTDRVLNSLPDARLLREVPDQQREVIILGPPGTGKTRSLGVLVEAHIRAGAPPSQMLVNAFTRNATRELRTRLTQTYNLTEDDLEWVRTIHSTCHRLLGLRPGRVMSRALLRRFGEETGYTLQGVLNQRSLEDPYAVGAIVTFGDWCYTAEELRRVGLRSVEQNYRILRDRNPTDHEWSERSAANFSDLYARWKVENGLVDFSDMLEMVIENNLRPPVKWLFVDECQDLTPLQWAVIDLWAREAIRLFSFGDEDQCIFGWSGADPGAIAARNAHRFVLSHSYRLPEAIHGAAQEIITPIRERIEKSFSPRGPGGKVSTVDDWMEVSGRLGGESCLLLVRNRTFADAVRGALVESVVPFFDRTSPAGIPDPGTQLAKALSIAVSLSAGGVVTAMELRLLQSQVDPALWPAFLGGGLGGRYDLSSLRQVGVSDDLAETLRRDPLRVLELEPYQRRYLRALVAKFGARVLVETPLIQISTIHGAKGEEAEKVAISTSMTRRTRNGFEDDPDGERRVFYVAVTRARQEVVWVRDGPGWTPGRTS